LQHPSDCSRRAIVTFKDWRNGLGAQLSSLVGAWAAQIAKAGSIALSPTAAEGARLPPVLVPLGGLRYANKARCAQRDLDCYFERFAACAAPPGAKTARAAKTPTALSERLSDDLSLRRRRDKWWLRKELTRYVFRPNDETSRMLARVRAEMDLASPRHLEEVGPGGMSTDSGERAGRLRTDQLVAIHVRRGDKKDLGAKERGEPFTDAMYVRAALALADEVGASGFLLASSEPETLKRLPLLLRPRPTYVMPAHYFVYVPEGRTPHQVIEKTRQEGGSNDEGLAQIVQLLLLSECKAFLCARLATLPRPRARCAIACLVCL